MSRPWLTRGLLAAGAAVVLYWAWRLGLVTSDEARVRARRRRPGRHAFGRRGRSACQVTALGTLRRQLAEESWSRLAASEVRGRDGVAGVGSACARRMASPWREPSTSRRWCDADSGTARPAASPRSPARPAARRSAICARSGHVHRRRRGVAAVPRAGGSRRRGGAAAMKRRAHVHDHRLAVPGPSGRDRHGGDSGRRGRRARRSRADVLPAGARSRPGRAASPARRRARGSCSPTSIWITPAPPGRWCGGCRAAGVRPRHRCPPPGEPREAAGQRDPPLRRGDGTAVGRVPGRAGGLAAVAGRRGNARCRRPHASTSPTRRDTPCTT